MRKIRAVRIIILSSILILSVSSNLILLASCENISSVDINMDDLENILSVIIKDDDTPTTEAQQNITESSTSYTDSTPAVIETPIIQTVEISSEESIQISPSESEESHSGSTTSVQQLSAETDRVLSDAVKDFPDIPDTFKYLPFPSGLNMTEPLKQAIKNLDNLLKKDFNNSGFYVATTSPQLITPLPGRDKLNDARYYRTGLVETAYNINLESIYVSSDKMYQFIADSVKAGEYVSDIVCVPLNIQSLLIQGGLVVNLRKMPFMNLAADYYNQSSIKANTLNGEIYGVVSDLVFDPAQIYGFFYNKNLLQLCGIDSLDSLYESEEWTYENMLAICKTLTTTVDTAANDLFTIGLNSENKSVVNGMRILPDILLSTESDTITFKEKIENIISRILYNTDGISPLISTDDEMQRNTFANGSMLFAVMTLDIIPEITDSAFDWSVLPVPAPEKNQNKDYSFSFTDGNALCISILKGVRNTEKCGLITEALSLASYDYMRDMYVNDLMTYNLRDMMSVNMINMMVNNIKFP